MKKLLHIVHKLIRMIEQSSQWDGLRHHPQPLDCTVSDTSENQIWYGGTTEEEIMSPDNNRIGIQHWALEGIAGKCSQTFPAQAQNKGLVSSIL